MSRSIDVADALDWMRARRGTAAGIVAALPDAHEIGLDDDLDGYVRWYADAIAECALTAGPSALVVVATDRRINGHTIDKAALIVDAVRLVGWHRWPTWHKIALRRAPGRLDLKRPTFSHLLAFGGTPGRRTTDVIPPSTPLWANGPGVQVARLVAAWFAEVGVDGVLNPFCGMGTFVAACDAVGLDVAGCDLDPARAAVARTTVLPAELDLGLDPLDPSE